MDTIFPSFSNKPLIHPIREVRITYLNNSGCYSEGFMAIPWVQMDSRANLVLRTSKYPWATVWTVLGRFLEGLLFLLEYLFEFKWIYLDYIQNWKTNSILPQSNPRYWITSDKIKRNVNLAQEIPFLSLWVVQPITLSLPIRVENNWSCDNI